MKALLHLILVFLFISISESCLPQKDYPLTTKSKKAEKAYHKAIKFYDSYEYEFAESELKKAISADPEFIEAYLLLGDLNADIKKYEKSIEYYSKAIEIDPEFFPRTFYNLATIEISIGSYQDAKNHFESYLSGKQVNRNLVEKVQRHIETCEYAIEAIKNPVPFNPVNLGSLVNSENEEHSPSITADDMYLIFTVKRPRDPYTECAGCKEEEDFYFSRFVDGKWTKAQKIPPPLNTHYNEGVQSISPDGKTLFFTSCNREDGFGSCDLYISKSSGGNWSKPKNLGPVVNSRSWDTQPSIASDGRTLYFASARKGGKGNVDIWKCQLQQDGRWGIPENLGDSINTAYAEMAPFIHPDNQTLYFISEGHTGMGGMDIFYSRKNESGEWTKPVNIGYPINTYADERSLAVNAAGNKAYFSSNIPGGSGKFDLYYFELYEEARPKPVNYMKGIVFDIETKKKLEAKFELINLETAQTVVESYSDPVSGEFLVSLPTDQNYALNVSRDGYLFYSDNFALTGTHSNIDPFHKDVPLTPIKEGSIIVLKNIFFDTDKYDLKPESLVELNILVDLLNKNEQIKIELRGHTDNIGGEEHNKILSLNRSKAVYEYLINHGIDKNRLSYNGYGYSQPIDTNETSEGRANNRRTEFKVVGD